MKIACIGSRDLSAEQLAECREIGKQIALRGWEVHSGNAQGADQAFAQGANGVDPKLVHLHLPWSSFNRNAVVEGNQVSIYPFDHPRFYMELAEATHPRWDQLKDAVRKLHARNVSILLPKQENVQACIAWPSNRLGGGGTGQGMRIAQERLITLIDLRETSSRQVCYWIKSTKNSK